MAERSATIRIEVEHELLLALLHEIQYLRGERNKLVEQNSELYQQIIYLRREPTRINVGLTKTILTGETPDA